MKLRSWNAGILVGVAFIGVLASSVVADEGMWVFNNLPTEKLKTKYNFEPSKEWLDNLMKSSVRFNSGGSGSFVSGSGLIMTNHHVAADALQKLSTKDRNLLEEGFYAKTMSEEVKCVDLELNVLMGIEDVTDQIAAAVKDKTDPAAAFQARRAAFAKIENEATEKTKLRCDIVTLYQGGQYHLYMYKKYTDVRLVFAPEQKIAFFGGDPDNFEFPRFDLDVSFFRVYENDKPAKIDNFLRWSEKGVSEGELIFVSGHPGRTDRINTVSELEFIRDHQMPLTLQYLYRSEVLMRNFGERSEENARQAREDFFSIQNSRKAREGGLAGLLDPAIMAAKRESERGLREAVARDPKLKAYSDAWDRIAKAQRSILTSSRQYMMLEGGRAFSTELFTIARTLVRAADEKAKPNADRLREFRQSALQSLEFQLFSEQPIHPGFEEIKLAHSLTWMMEQMSSSKDRIVEQILAKKSPRERAAELIKGTKLYNVAERKRLYEGGKKAIAESKDPMIQLAKMIDGPSRAYRKNIETQSEIKSQAYEQIAKAKFAIEGTKIYPDATFTLRLSYGVVKGYEENGEKVPYQTNFAGLYQRSREHKNMDPFTLPKRWIDGEKKLNPLTPFNFISTPDIIGGNSGSPVVNRAGEVVGLIFDGNLPSLVWGYVYDDKTGRSTSVHTKAIGEALRKLYNAGNLASELGH